MSMNPGRLVEYADPKTETRRAAILCSLGHKNAALVPLSAGRVAVISVPAERLVRQLPHSRTATRRWIVKIAKQGMEWGITKGAKKALTAARNATTRKAVQ